MNYLKTDRKGTGGLLILYSGAFLSLMLVLTISLIKVSTSRSVAESVEHTIAMECLASSYVNNVNSQTWTSDHVFDSITKTGQSIDPKKQFNSVMTSYHLIDPSSTGKETIYMKYNRRDSGGLPSFTLQISNWDCNISFWTQKWTITPNPAKVTIENNYFSRIGKA